MADPEAAGCVLVAETNVPWEYGLIVDEEGLCRWPGPALTGLQCRLPAGHDGAKHRGARLVADGHLVFEWETDPATGLVVAPSADATDADPNEVGASASDGEGVAAEDH